MFLSNMDFGVLESRKANFKTRKILFSFVLVIILTMLFLPVIVTGNQHEESGEYKNQVSTEGLSSINLFFANLYNDHRLIYALVTTAMMALSGAVIALLVDFFLRKMGLSVNKMKHKE